MKMPGETNAGQRGPLMRFQVKRANGRTTIRVRIGDLAITVVFPV